MWGDPYPAALVTLREHDNDGALLLEDHLPEVVPGLRERALRGDILPGGLVTLGGEHTDTDTQLQIHNQDMGLLVLDIAMRLPGGGRVSYGNVVGVDVVRALVVVH